ncbi:hypothetical protein WG66_003901 [Moniliophthora roreri]|nr:hypothetical protein WG66_003901 [Moniliophthora roreri]
MLVVADRGTGVLIPVPSSPALQLPQDNWNRCRSLSLSLAVIEHKEDQEPILIPHNPVSQVNQPNSEDEDGQIPESRIR